MFIHPLTVVRSTFDDSSVDDYGQPTVTTEEIETRGLVQPMSVKEQADTRSAGAEIADHRIFLPLSDNASADVIVYDSRRYQVTGIKRHEYGNLQHLEVLARLVTSAADVVDVGS